MIYKKIKTTLQFLNRHAGDFLLMGLIGLGLRFYRRWQKKRHKISQMEEDIRPLPPIEQRSTTPLVTLLVAAWNEEAYIEGFLRSFADLDYPNKELILVAGGSDSTFRMAHQWASPQITVLEQQAGEGKYRALQRAYRVAHGDIVFLTDADCLLNSESFRLMIAPIISGRERVVTGRIRPLPHQLSNPFVYAQWIKRQFETMQSNPDRYVSSLMGGNSAIVHSLLEICWADSSNQPVGEDHYFALCLQKAGHKIYEVRESYVETRFAESMGEYIQRQSRWHRGWLILNYQFGDQRWRGNMLTLLKSQAMLAMPFFILLFGPIVAVVWLLGWVHFFTPYLFTKLWTEQSEEKDSVALVSLCQLMLADFGARAIVLPQLLKSEWRDSW